VGALVATGCGDPLVDGEYPGESLLSVISTVEFGTLDELDTGGDLRVAMFWLGDVATFENDEGVLEIPEQQVLISKLPGYYGFNLYETPPESASIEDGDESYAIGSILLYIDHDMDGSWDREEDPLIGAVSQRLYLFTRDGATLEGETFTAGYHGLRVKRDGAQTVCSDGRVELSPADPESPVVVDYLHQVLIDTDCDGEASEWDLCPPPADVTAACAPNWSDAECWPWRHCDAGN
jgi:hypothetical protein